MPLLESNFLKYQEVSEVILAEMDGVLEFKELILSFKHFSCEYFFVQLIWKEQVQANQSLQKVMSFFGPDMPMEKFETFSF